MSSKIALNLYARYFWDMELNRVTKAYGAYVNGEFVGVLLAAINGEEKIYYSGWRSVYVRFFDWLQKIAARKDVDIAADTVDCG